MGEIVERCCKILEKEAKVKGGGRDAGQDAETTER
jgi:hypothetical protein